MTFNVVNRQGFSIPRTRQPIRASCSKADQRYQGLNFNRVSFSFIQKHFLGKFSLYFLDHPIIIFYTKRIKLNELWYGMVTLFIHGISIRYIYIRFKYRKTNFLTNLKYKIKTKIIEMKRKHLLFKEAVCKNRISLIKLFVNQNLCLLIFP